MRRFRGICSVDGCEKHVSYLRLCSMHVQRFKKTGDVGPVGLLDRSGANNANWRGGRRRGGHEGRYWMVYARVTACSLDGCDRPLLPGRRRWHRPPRSKEQP